MSVLRLLALVVPVTEAERHRPTVPSNGEDKDGQPEHEP